MATELDNPFSYFTDRRGDALDQGYVYIGEANKDPELFPIDLFWDEAMTVPAVQPLRTVAGYVVNPGAGNSPGNIYFAEAEYSIRIRDRNAVQVFYVAAAEDRLSAFAALLASAQGASLIGYKAPWDGSETRTVKDKLDEVATSILDFRYAIDTVDTDAFQRAVEAGVRLLYFPAGKGLGPDGVYLVTTIASVAGNLSKAGYLLSDTYLFGDGMGQTIIRPENPEETIFRAFSDAPDETIDNVTIRDMTLYGYVEGSGFSEHIHLAAMNAVRNFLAERVEFKGFQGDGLYFGIGEITGTLRHNYNVTVNDCVFDGVNKDNRNGVSFVDVDGATVEGCYFTRCTRSNMPGTIDFEPDPTNPAYVIRNVDVLTNRFSDNGGNLGAVSVFIPSALSELPQGIRIRDNSFDEYAGTGADICIIVHRQPTAADLDMAVIIQGNRGSGGVSPMFLFSGTGIRVDETNVFEGYSNSCIMGGAAVDDLVLGGYFRPTLRNCGSAAVAGVAVGNAVGVEFGGDWYKCGQTGAGGFPMQITGDTDSITLSQLNITGNTSQTVAINVDGGTLVPANNRVQDCDFGGLISQFVALAPGQPLYGSVAFNPPSLPPGVGATAAVTVSGAAFGDYTDVSFNADLQGVQLTSYVSAANTVTALFHNRGGGAVDLPAGIVDATVTKKQA